MLRFEGITTVPAVLKRGGGLGWAGEREKRRTQRALCLKKVFVVLGNSFFRFLSLCKTGDSLCTVGEVEIAVIETSFSAAVCFGPTRLATPRHPPWYRND